LAGWRTQFHFGYQQRTGNFDVKVRSAGWMPSDLWAKAGLMARENLEPDSRYAAVLATPSLGGNFFSARTQSSAAAAISGQFPVNYPYNWLRLQRDGSVFRGFASYDGQLWYPLGSASMNLPNAICSAWRWAAIKPATAAQFVDLGEATGEPTSATAAANRSRVAGPSSRRTGMVISEIMYRPLRAKTGAISSLSNCSTACRCRRIWAGGS
jgi:hypothetical protein